MPNPRLAARYAKSIIDLSLERGQLELVYADMQWLQAVCKSNADFVNLLRSPVVKSDTKQKILDAVTAGRLSELTNAFITLLIKKNRESHLPEIVTSFITLYKEHKNIHTVKLTTAVPASDSVRTAIIEQVKKSGGFENVELEEKVNPDLIGGFVLQVGDKLVDASIAYDLKTIAKQFENNDFIYKVR
ncbi:MAG TPA: ATP synthase F1 subunit delta [Chitinophagaceae bacterium]|jgi:F-type H+-transporting ATPase subunit delta|nr:ATP synthase F1 subunit delta [Chitinophagaceae bacterium]